MRECATRPGQLRRLAAILEAAAASLRAEGTRTRVMPHGDVDCVAEDGTHVILGSDLEERATITVAAVSDVASVVLGTPVLLPRPASFGTECGRPVENPVAPVLEALTYAAAGLKAAADPARRVSLDQQGAMGRRLEVIACAIEAKGGIDVSAGIDVAAPGPFWPVHAQTTVVRDGGRAWEVVETDASWWSGLPPVLALYVTAPLPERQRLQGAEWERRSWSMELAHVRTDWRGVDDPVERLRMLAELPGAGA
jgi:hypothetical protein